MLHLAMAKKRNTATHSSDSTYSFSGALSFAKRKKKFQDWQRVLSKEDDDRVPDVSDQFAQLKGFHGEVKSQGGVREIIIADPAYAERLCIASQLLALQNK